MNLKDLKQTIPFKWKVQSFVSNETKGLCVGYIDSRDVMDLLDKVCGAENWQKKYYTVKNTLVCSIGIKTSDEWVWKDDGGTESFTDKEKGECSDAFKRAGVCWGIGRFLYDLDFKYVAIQNKKPVDINGKRIYDLTKHFANVTQPIKDDRDAIKVVEKFSGEVVHHTKLISEKQGNRLWAIGKGKGVDENKVAEHIFDKYGYNNNTEIEVKNYDAIVKWVEDYKGDVN